MLCICSCATTPFLKEASISFLNVVLFLSSIFRKSSWENDETKVKSLFVMETVADIILESCTFFEDYFLLSMTKKDVSFLIS